MRGNVKKRFVAYQKKHKDSWVPIKHNEDPQLGTWVRNQCTTYKNNKMAEERKRIIDSDGFVVPDLLTKKLAAWYSN